MARPIKAFFIFDNKTGCRFVTVDAYRSAMPFYEKNGSLPLLEEDDGELPPSLEYCHFVILAAKR